MILAVDKKKKTKKIQVWLELEPWSLQLQLQEGLVSSWLHKLNG